MLASDSQYTGFKNRIINGAMVIDQRNAGASVTPNGTYTLDRWYAVNSQTGKFSVQQVTDAPTGFANSLKITSLSAYSITSGDYFDIAQSIEGFNIADLGWGTASAKTVTLSFWTKSSLTGTFGGVIRNASYDYNYPFTYTISSANTWEYKTVTITGATSGTWLTTNGIGASVWFGLGVGSTYSGTAGAWGTLVGASSATGAVSVVGTSGATFYLTGVQLEKGSTATSFDYRPYSAELAMCQRYYQQITYAGSTINYLSGTAYDTFSIYDTTVYTLPVTMRSAPTFSTAGTFLLADGLGNNPAITTLTIGSMSMANSFKVVVVSSGLTTGRTYYLISTASSALKISAEL
jgi:hypothetical protein